MIEKADDLITNALAGVPSVYFVASFYEFGVGAAKAEKVSLAGACVVEAARNEMPRTSIMRDEVMRLHVEGLVSPVQRRTVVDGLVTIEYIAQSNRKPNP
jgi:hypothetical protein